MKATDTVSMSKKFLDQINEIFGPSKLRHRLKYGVARDVIGVEYLRIEREREIKTQKDIISELRELDVDSMSPEQLDDFLKRYRAEFGSISPATLKEDVFGEMTNKLARMAMARYTHPIDSDQGNQAVGEIMTFGENVTVLDADDPDLMEKITQASNSEAPPRPAPVDPEPVDE